MDLMRTLLIYMSATLALAVQNTAAPVETPVPTQAPQAVVETVNTPGPGEEPMITAKATQAPAQQPQILLGVVLYVPEIAARARDQAISSVQLRSFKTGRHGPQYLRGINVVLNFCLVQQQA